MLLNIVVNVLVSTYSRQIRQEAVGLNDIIKQKANSQGVCGVGGVGGDNNKVNLDKI